MTDPAPTDTVKDEPRPTIREAVEARLAKRHAKERGFRRAGIIAIGFAAFMLVTLLTSIFWQASSAFQKNYVFFDTTITTDLAYANGRSPEEIAENVSGFYEIVKDDLQSSFPHAPDTVAVRAQLNQLVTRLAVLPVARKVADDADRIGAPLKFKAALNDDLDLFLKGRLSETKRYKLGDLTMTGQIGEARIEGDFSTVLADVKEEIARLADADEALLKGVQIRLAQLEAQREAEGDSAELQAGIDAANAEIAELESLIAALRTRAADAEAPEVLDASLPSVLVKFDGSYVDVAAVGPEGVVGEILVGPPDLLTATPRPTEALLIRIPEAQRTVTDRQIAWTLSLKDRGRIRSNLNMALLTNADSTYPEIAGALAAIVGSLFTMLVTALLALPIGIAAAIYLEEYAPKNRFTDFVEVNINNLAAVPSIVFGLLGAAVFLNFFGMPRSAPFVGGMVLALLTLPTVIIASRAALKAVPPSIRDAALGVGASRTQAVFHHVVPLAAPGMMTGAIIGLARAIGETAPLLLIGMVAFVAEVPTGPDDEATALPVLIYKWSTGAERAWEPLTAAAIVVLLVFMILMNAVAVILRRRFERRW